MQLVYRGLKMGSNNRKDNHWCQFITTKMNAWISGDIQSFFIVDRSAVQWVANPLSCYIPPWK